MNGTNSRVDGYLRKNKRWRQELQELRNIALDRRLVEEVKWRVPCYTSEGKNILFLGAFKESCTIGFVNGALLRDPGGILEKPGENSQSSRRIRFTRVQEIIAIAPVFKAYIDEAVRVAKAGLKVKLKKVSESDYPEELKRTLDEDPALKTAFGALTPGRQRGYLLHFSGAKQSKTRQSRVEKCIARILDGKGLDDE